MFNIFEIKFILMHYLLNNEDDEQILSEIKKQSSYLLPRFLQPEELGVINAWQLPYPDIVKGYGEFKWISSL